MHRLVDHKFPPSFPLVSHGFVVFPDPDCTIEPALFPNVLKECSPIPNRSTGKVCRFSCREGYQLSGPQSSYCYSGNVWTNTSPTCRREYDHISVRVVRGLELKSMNAKQQKVFLVTLNNYLIAKYARKYSDVRLRIWGSG